MIKFSFGDVSPSVLNWFIVGLMAISFIALAKYAVNTLDNPITTFLKPIVNAA